MATDWRVIIHLMDIVFDVQVGQWQDVIDVREVTDSFSFLQVYMDLSGSRFIVTNRASEGKKKRGGGGGGGEIPVPCV